MAVAGEEAAGRRRRRGDRRRDGSGDLVIICWRDIPAQVNFGSGNAKVQRILPRRFQRAIDEAAMAAGMSSASQYIGEWRRITRSADGDDPEGAALRVAAELEAEFPRERLRTFVATGGWDPEGAESLTADAAGSPDGENHQEGST